MLTPHRILKQMAYHSFPPPLSFLREWVRWYHSGSHPRQACGQRHSCTPPPSKEKSFTHPRRHVPNCMQSARGWLVQKTIPCTSVWTTIAMWAVSVHTLNTHCRLQSCDSHLQQTTTPTMHTSCCLSLHHHSFAPCSPHCSQPHYPPHSSCLAMHPSHCHTSSVLYIYNSTESELNGGWVCSCVIWWCCVNEWLDNCIITSIDHSSCQPACLSMCFEVMGITSWHRKDDPRATPDPAARAVRVVRITTCHPWPLLNTPWLPSCHPFMTHHEVVVDALRWVGGGAGGMQAVHLYEHPLACAVCMHAHMYSCANNTHAHTRTHTKHTNCSICTLCSCTFLTKADLSNLHVFSVLCPAV